MRADAQPLVLLVAGSTSAAILLTVLFALLPLQIYLPLLTAFFALPQLKLYYVKQKPMLHFIHAHGTLLYFI